MSLLILRNHFTFSFIQWQQIEKTPYYIVTLMKCLERFQAANVDTRGSFTLRRVIHDGQSFNDALFNQGDMDVITDKLIAILQGEQASSIRMEERFKSRPRRLADNTQFGAMWLNEED